MLPVATNWRRIMHWHSVSCVNAIANLLPILSTIILSTIMCCFRQHEKVVIFYITPAAALCSRSNVLYCTSKHNASKESPKAYTYSGRERVHLTSILSSE